MHACTDVHICICMYVCMHLCIGMQPFPSSRFCTTFGALNSTVNSYLIVLMFRYHVLTENNNYAHVLINCSYVLIYTSCSITEISLKYIVASIFSSYFYIIDSKNHLIKSNCTMNTCKGVFLYVQLHNRLLKSIKKSLLVIH